MVAWPRRGFFRIGGRNGCPGREEDLAECSCIQGVAVEALKVDGMAAGALVERGITVGGREGDRGGGSCRYGVAVGFLIEKGGLRRGV